MSYTLSLPWPARELSPNARCHWAKKARAAKAAKEEGYYAMLEAKLRNGERALEGPIELLLILRPPDKKRRDDDNVLASLKNFRDGVFAALGVDDSKVRRTVIEWGDPTPGGRVVMTVQEMIPFER